MDSTTLFRLSCNLSSSSSSAQMMIKSSLTHPVAFVAAAAHILLHLAPFPTFSFIIGKVASACYLDADDKLLLTCWSPPLFPSSSPSCSPCPPPRSPGSPCCTCPPSLRSLLFRVIAPLLRMADPQNLSFFWVHFGHFALCVFSYS